MKKRSVVILLIAIAYFAFSLFLYGDRSLGFDEASHSMSGIFFKDFLSAVISGKDVMDFVGDYQDHYKIWWNAVYYPPLQHVLIAAAYLVTGVSEKAPLLVNAVAGALSLIFTYMVARKVYGGSSLAMPLVLGFSPAFFFYARSVYPDVPLAFFYLLSFYLFLRYTDEPSWQNAALIGVSAGLGFLVKYPAALAVPAIFLSLALARKPLRGAAPALAAFLILALPWPLMQVAVNGSKYAGNWLTVGFDPQASGMANFPPLAERAVLTIGNLANDLSLPLALFVLAGLLSAILVFETADQEKKNKMIALACWAFLYLAAFTILPLAQHPATKYRYLLPALPLLVALSLGSLRESIGKGVTRLICIVLLLILPFFVLQFDESQSYFVPAQETADYFLALSNSANKAPIKVLVQDPVLTLALRERDPELKRFFMFYYPPTLKETEDLLAGNSSSRSLQFFGLKSCGIEYATLINYGFADEKPNVAKEMVRDLRFDRLIKGKNGSSVEIYEMLNVTKC